MVDFVKFSSEEYLQRQKEHEEREEREEELRKQTACFTGHRKIGGYDMKNPMALRLKDKLIETIELAMKQEGVTRFISGGALGTDQIAFWCVHILKNNYPNIKNIVAIPFKNQDKVWNKEQKHWYHKMLKLADEVVNVEELGEYKTKNDEPLGEFSVAKMQKRNEYMVDKSSVIIAVYDGSKGGTANCLWYARKMAVGHRALYRLDPRFDFELDVSYM
jgi:uncharacterized phage-like protein YoqJ